MHLKKMKMDLMLLLLLFSLYLGSLHGAEGWSFLKGLGSHMRKGKHNPLYTRPNSNPLPRSPRPNSNPLPRSPRPNSNPLPRSPRPKINSPTKPTSVDRAGANCKQACVAAAAKLSVDHKVVAATAGAPTSCDNKAAYGIIENACNVACSGPRASGRASARAIESAAKACVADKANAPSADTYSPSADAYYAYSPSADAYSPSADAYYAYSPSADAYYSSSDAYSPSADAYSPSADAPADAGRR